MLYDIRTHLLYDKRIIINNNRYQKHQYRKHRYVRLDLPLPDHMLQDLRFLMEQITNESVHSQ
jgi:hypothetical protein